jgi:hypothetical protein
MSLNVRGVANADPDRVSLVSVEPGSRGLSGVSRPHAERSRRIDLA